MRIVIALGGNALLKRGEVLSADNQRKNMASAAAGLAEIIADNEAIIVHGNGPQVGLLALEGEAYKGAPAYPLDILGAESQGMIGYIIEQSLRAHMPKRSIVTLLTQIEVDGDDPAFDNPTKFIGPVYQQAEAEKLSDERGWVVKPDGQYYRRVVPSPIPKNIIETAQIKILMQSGSVVVCAGGGGIPVMQKHGIMQGVEAVIDKDLAAALLAEKLNADKLFVLTDIDGIYENWGTDKQQIISEITEAALSQKTFAEGSMAPKVRAVCKFVKATSHPAAIGALTDIVAISVGKAGTQILR